MSEREPGTRFLLYSHDGLGLGHTRRNLAVASALRSLAPDAAILLATGTEDVHRLGLPPDVEVLKIPGLRKVSNGQYEARHLPVPPDEIRSLRSHLLAATVEAFRPSAILADKHPFGPNGELLDALRILRADGGRAILGLRDILDDPAEVHREWAPSGELEQVAANYDRVLVYGDSTVFNPVEAYAFPYGVARRTIFCGYVVAPPHEPPVLEDGPPPVGPRPHDRPVVLATAGGGEDGSALLEAFLLASADAAWEAIAVGGPLMPHAERAALQTLAAKCGAAFRAFVPGLSGYLGRTDAIVCMGGYNTLAEAASRGLPTVCVPRTEPRKEQLMRATAFESLGLLRMIRPDDLSPARLRRGIGEALRGPRRTCGPEALRWDGARRAAEALLRVARIDPIPNT